jgi:outer membrane protein OmpA-like peptidoglycan-associated protein
MSENDVPTDWAADVKRYVPDADDAVIAKIVRYCGIALRTRDASLVSFTDPKETARVRQNYCRKKLGLEDSDEVLDAAIASVGQRMSDTTFRNRVTVYYLLAEHFGKLSVFGAPVAAAAAAAVAAPPAAPVAANDGEAPIAPLAAAAPAAAAAAAPAPAHGGHADRRGSDDGFVGFAALVFVGAALVMLFAAIAGSYIAGRFDKEETPVAAPPAPPPAPEPSAPAIPEGAGIVSEVVEGRPKVSVYFAVGKAEISPDFAAAVAPIKAWLEAHPDDRVQLSGFTDPTGNAAANAELAKNRAQGVAAALAAEGIANERMDLVKPADSSDESVDLAGARRVEITVTPG